MTPSAKQIEILKELFNIGIGRGAAVLNTMLKSHIALQVPTLLVLRPNEMEAEMARFGDKRIAVVNMAFEGKFSGIARLIFPTDIANTLVTAMMGENPAKVDSDAIRPGAFCEIGNVVLNNILGTLANILNLQFDFSVPSYMEETATRLFKIDPGDTAEIVLLARTQFIIEALAIEGDIMVFLEVKALQQLLITIDKYGQDIENASS